MTDTTKTTAGTGTMGLSASERTRCEVWTRVMGYHRPVSHFNPGKKSEHYSRKHFKECIKANMEFEKAYKVAA